jgi:hypothetical protein
VARCAAERPALQEVAVRHTSACWESDRVGKIVGVET